ncbi:MAG: PilZ domain-containing protein [Candidatus Omnitrophota bacterium]
MKERRKYPRISTERKVLWRKIDTMDNIDEATNISAGGLCLSAANEKPAVAGDSFQLQFGLAAKNTVYARAKAVWVSDVHKDAVKTKKIQNIGLEYVDISDDARKSIDHFINAS